MQVLVEHFNSYPPSVGAHLMQLGDVQQGLNQVFNQVPPQAPGTCCSTDLCSIQTWFLKPLMTHLGRYDTRSDTLLTSSSHWRSAAPLHSSVENSWQDTHALTNHH